MEQYQDDIVEAFQLIVTFDLAGTAESLFRQQFPGFLTARFDGLLPAQDTEAQRQSTQHVAWPPAEIRPFIERTGAPTMDVFLKTIKPMVDRHLNRHAFVLLTTAFDSFLDRRGFEGTLGKRFADLKKQRNISNDLDCDMGEIIQRRNDIAHGGVVSANYISGVDQYGRVTSAHQSSWIANHGVPQTAGSDHDFRMEYLYWATSTMHRVALLV